METLKDLEEQKRQWIRISQYLQLHFNSLGTIIIIVAGGSEENPTFKYFNCALRTDIFLIF